jgi:hypothetical protein
MSKHWRPTGHSDGLSARKVALMVLISVALGLAIGAGLSYWSSGPQVLGKPDKPIKWDEVQAHPKAALSDDDRLWEGRVRAAQDKTPATTTEAPDGAASGDQLQGGDQAEAGASPASADEVSGPQP